MPANTSVVTFPSAGSSRVCAIAKKGAILRCSVHESQPACSGLSMLPLPMNSDWLVQYSSSVLPSDSIMANLFLVLSAAGLELRVSAKGTSSSDRTAPSATRLAYTMSCAMVSGPWMPKTPVATSLMLRLLPVRFSIVILCASTASGMPSS